MRDIQRDVLVFSFSKDVQQLGVPGVGVTNQLSLAIENEKFMLSVRRGSITSHGTLT